MSTNPWTLPYTCVKSGFSADHTRPTTVEVYEREIAELERQIERKRMEYQAYLAGLDAIHVGTTSPVPDPQDEGNQFP